MLKIGNYGRSVFAQEVHNVCSHTEGPYHDCAYVNARNSLLTRAERAVDLIAYESADDVAWGAAFLRAMDALYCDGMHLEPSDPHDGDN